VAVCADGYSSVKETVFELAYDLGTVGIGQRALPVKDPVFLFAFIGGASDHIAGISPANMKSHAPELPCVGTCTGDMQCPLPGNNRPAGQRIMENDNFMRLVKNR